MTGRVFKKIAKTLVVAGIMLLATQAYAKDNRCGECHTSKEMASFGNVMGWVALFLGLVAAVGLIAGLIGMETGMIRREPPPAVHAKAAARHGPRRRMPSPCTNRSSMNSSPCW